MRDKAVTKDFYLNTLGFEQCGGDYDGYLMVRKDRIQIHFFEFKDLDPKENYGQVYIRTDDITAVFHSAKERNANTTDLEHKPWKQREFSMLDPDSNLLTFGESIF